MRGSSSGLGTIDLKFGFAQFALRARAGIWKFENEILKQVQNLETNIRNASICHYFRFHNFHPGI
jgi:hypothetical protein